MNLKKYYVTFFSSLSDEQYKLIYKYYLRYIQTHPPTEEHIANINKRIDVLQQQEWEKYAKNIGNNSLNKTNEN